MDAIETWLAPVDPSENQNRAAAKRHEDSGRWFITSDELTTWVQGETKVLWLHGLPGCGKTVLISSIIARLQENKPRGCLLYFYFDFSEVEKQPIEALLHSLTWQLYHGYWKCRGPLDALYNDCGRGKKRPAFEALVNTFNLMLYQGEHVRIVLDALDESSTRHASLEWLKGVSLNVTKPKANIQFLMTSRRETDIEESLDKWVPSKDMIGIQNDKVNDDIRLYVHHRIHTDDSFRRWHGMSDVLYNIEYTLSRKADGM